MQKEFLEPVSKNELSFPEIKPRGGFTTIVKDLFKRGFAWLVSNFLDKCIVRPLLWCMNLNYNFANILLPYVKDPATYLNICTVNVCPRKKDRIGAWGQWTERFPRDAVIAEDAALNVALCHTVKKIKDEHPKQFEHLKKGKLILAQLSTMLRSTITAFIISKRGKEGLE